MNNFDNSAKQKNLQVLFDGITIPFSARKEGNRAIISSDDDQFLQILGMKVWVFDSAGNKGQINYAPPQVQFADHRKAEQLLLEINECVKNADWTT